MKISTLFILAQALIMAFCASVGLAADYVPSLRCGPKLVSVGDNKLDVLSKCGEPDMREKITGLYGSQVEEEWIYNLGSGDFMYTLTFEGGALKSIARGGRGSSR